jgi:hypothetical protein
MQSGQRDYIRDLYRTLTDIGEEADKTVDARFGVEATTTVKKTAAPTVKVTQPPLPGVAQRPPPQPVPSAQPQSAQGTPATPATSLSVRNPFSVVGAAIRAVGQRRVPAFWLGAIFVLAFGLMSTVVIGSNLQKGTVETDRGPLQPIMLAVVVYLVCWWMRMGGNPRNTPFTGAIRLSDVFAAGAVGIGAYAVLPLFYTGSALPAALQWAAFLTRHWPLQGPYASMVLAPLRAISAALPAATTFWEPFTDAAVLIALFPLVPFIVRERVKRGAKMVHLLVRAPLLIVALAVCTLPIAVLSATLAGLTADLTSAQNTFAASLIMAAIFYVQLVLSAATIGEFYRRVSLSHP